MGNRWPYQSVLCYVFNLDTEGTRREREREMKIGRAGELRRVHHTGSGSTVEPLASPRGEHRCSSTGAQTPARVLLCVFFANSHMEIGCYLYAKGCSELCK